MTPENFLSQMGFAPNLGGDGIKVDQPLSLLDFTTASTGAPLTTASNPRCNALETNFPGIQWAASDVTPGGILIPIPRDYDEAKDFLKLHILACTSGATTPALSVAVYRKRAGAALSANLGPKAGDISVPAGVANAAIVTVDLSGLLMKGQDVVALVVTPAAHGTDTLNVYEAVLSYKSTIVTYNTSDRA